mmetsp:Transcript_32413/g.75574  ORF Transcript_32413/g.75574 Transcript_32413/m.75574 type:complete len:224 (-) Transcript_32413:1108-1779(-)
MPYSAVSGVCSFCRASTSQRVFCSALSREKRLVPSKRAGSIRLRTARMISAAGLIFLSSDSTVSQLAPLSRSVLLSSSTSENSSWSQSRCATVRSSSSPVCQPRSASVSTVESCSKMDAASTTVTRLWRLATAPSCTPVSASAYVKVSATGSGSEMPDDSIKTWSKRRSAARAASDVSRSSRRVQQMQPFDSSTIFSRTVVPRRTSSASTLTDAMSLTMMAMR